MAKNYDGEIKIGVGLDTSRLNKQILQVDTALKSLGKNVHDNAPDSQGVQDWVNAFTDGVPRAETELSRLTDRIINVSSVLSENKENSIADILTAPADSVTQIEAVKNEAMELIEAIKSSDKTGFVPQKDIDNVEAMVQKIDQYQEKIRLLANEYVTLSKTAESEKDVIKLEKISQQITGIVNSADNATKRLYLMNQQLRESAQASVLATKISNAKVNTAKLKDGEDYLSGLKLVPTATSDFEALAVSVTKAQKRLNELKNSKDPAGAEKLSKNIQKTINQISKLQRKLEIQKATYNKSVAKAQSKSDFLGIAKQASAIDDTTRAINAQKSKLDMLTSSQINAGKASENTSAKMYYLVRSLKMAKFTIDSMQKGLKKTIAIFMKLGKVAIRSLFWFAPNMKKNKQASDTFHFSLKKGLRAILKYGIGIRSLWILFNRLRAGMVEGFGYLTKASSKVMGQVQSLSRNMMMMKASIAAMIQPLLNVIVPAMNAVTRVFVSATNAIAQFFAVLTGQSFVYKATKAMTDYGEATSGASKATKDLMDVTMGYDELNVINDKDKDSGGSGGGAPGVEFDTVETEKAVSEFAEKVKKVMQELFDPLKTAWDTKGQLVMTSWKTALDEVLATIGVIGIDFLDVWNNDTSIDTFTKLLNIIATIGQIVSTLAVNFRLAWQENNTGKTILEAIATIINTIVTYLDMAASATKTWAENLNFSPLMTAIASFLEKIQPLIEGVSGIMYDFYTMVLLPLAEWTIEKGLPDLLDVMSRLGTDIDWESLRTKLQDLWKALEPFAEKVGEGLIIFIGDLVDKVTEFVGSDTFQTFIDWLIEAMEKATAEDIAKAIEDIAKALLIFTVSIKITKGILAIATGLGSLGLAITNLNTALPILEPIGAALLLIGGAIEFCKGMLDAVENGLTKVNSLMMVIGAILAAIGAVLLGIPAAVAFVAAGIVTAVTMIVIAIVHNWDKIKAFFATIWKHITDFFAMIGNAIVAFKDLVVSLIMSLIIALVAKVVYLIHAITEKWEALKTWAKEKLDAIKQWFSDIGKAISDWWDRRKQDWSNMKLAVKNAWKNAKKYIDDKAQEFKDKFDEVVDFLKDIPGKVWNAIIGAINKVVEWGAEILGQFKTAIDEVLKKVKDWFSDLPSKIAAGIKSKLEDVLAIGKWLWHGIKKGFTNALNSVKDGVASIGNAITSKFKDFFDINSPSKVFRDEIGYWLGAGTVLGTADGLKDASANKALGESASEFGSNLSDTIADSFEDVSVDDMDISANVEFDSEGVTDSMNEAYDSTLEHWQNASTDYQQIADTIANIFILLSQKLKNISAVSNDNIKKNFHTIWSDIVKDVVTILNVMIACIGTTFNAIINIMNSFVSEANEIMKKAAKVKKKSYDPLPMISGISLPNIKVPKLAEGGVIPPNSEFLAVLGDQKHGTNIEAPLSTIQDAVALVLEPYLKQLVANTDELASKDYSTYIGDKEIARAAKRGQKSLGFTLRTT